jgi:hypothetical protein
MSEDARCRRFSPTRPWWESVRFASTLVHPFLFLNFPFFLTLTRLSQIHRPLLFPKIHQHAKFFSRVFWCLMKSFSSPFSQRNCTETTYFTLFLLEDLIPRTPGECEGQLILLKENTLQIQSVKRVRKEVELLFSLQNIECYIRRPPRVISQAFQCLMLKLQQRVSYMYLHERLDVSHESNSIAAVTYAYGLMIYIFGTSRYIYYRRI